MILDTKAFSGKAIRSRKVSIIQLSALGPLREAIHRAQEALDQNSHVIFVCFRKDISDFLRPLASDRIEIHLHEESLTFTTSQWLAAIKALRTFHRKLESLYGQLGDAEVWGYASSISLASIVAFVFFTRRYTVYYNGVYEGRHAQDGIFYQRTNKVLRWAKGLMLSLIIGADIQFVRDWSPVPVLSETFIQKRTTPACCWEVATPRCALETRLLRPCSTPILLLFTDYSDYYAAGRKDRETFQAFCETLGQLLKQCSANIGVTIKPHPTCPKLPDGWGWMQQVAPGFPLEFLDFTHVRVVLGDSSTSMLFASQYAHKPVISYAELLETSWASEVVANLQKRINLLNKINCPQTWKEFHALLATSLKN